ncbi:MAG: rubrerythrin family protein [Chloroflexi bacterium]|nr:rubrerythrin family protein [Chloroflexota bacterium]
MNKGGIALELKGSSTEKNLLTAFAGESQARNRYTYFASQARTQGYVQIADIFEDTANQEKEHANRFFGMLQGGSVEIGAAFPAGTVGTTAENLRASAAGEHYEWEAMYPSFAWTAREEGFTEIAKLFSAITIAEKQHEKRYLGFLANVEAGTVFKKEEVVVWRGRNCGYLHSGIVDEASGKARERVADAEGKVKKVENEAKEKIAEIKAHARAAIEEATA